MPPSFEQLLDETPITPTQWQLWLLSAMGIFLDGFDLFIIGVALPLIRQDFQLTPTLEGLIAGAAVVGAFVGAAIGGIITDRLGRKGMFVIDLVFFVLFAAASACAWNPMALIVFRFLLGVGIGADYPIGVSYIAENVPTAMRGRLVVGAFSFQAIGALAGVAIGAGILAIDPAIDAWRWMLAFGVLPAVVVVLLRENLPESPRWHLSRGNYEAASQAASLLLHQPITLKPDTTAPPPESPTLRTLLSPAYRRRTILVSVPWFLQDIATYGIGIFTPTLLAALALSSPAPLNAGTNAVPSDAGTSALSTSVAQAIAATQGAILTNLPLLLGFLLCALWVESVGRIRLQIIGFVGMAIGLGLVALASGEASGGGEGNTPSIGLVFAGLMIFNLLMNLGPNSTTYLLSGEVFPTPIRATGAGLAAAIAKLGAVVGTLFFPGVQAAIGIPALLIGLAAISLLAAGITAGFQVNTTGRSLEKMAPDWIDSSDGLAPDRINASSP